jgi:hypothetical protein
MRLFGYRKMSIILVLAALLPGTSIKSVAKDGCSRIVHHEADAVMIGIGDRLSWNGEAVTRTQFETYLHDTWRKRPKMIFQLMWTTDKQPEAAKLRAEIEHLGFEVAVHCPPIPF